MLKLFLIFCALPGFSQEPNTEPDQAKEYDIAIVSEAMGHLIGKNLQSLGVTVDVNAVVKGIKDASLGKTSPLTEDECVQALDVLQEESLNTAYEKNLEEAETFLQKNKKEENVVSLEEGKLQYKIEKKGDGEAVQTYSSPIVQYTAKYLNGKIFGESTGEERLCLEETIPGFCKGVIGMREGEERTLFIHPEFGYGTQGQNALLIFEVKVLKADASSQIQTATGIEPMADLISSDNHPLETAPIR